MEEQCDGGQQAGHVAADTRAEGEKPDEEGDDREEERDEVEGEHEAGQVEVVFCPVNCTEAHLLAMLSANPRNSYTHPMKCDGMLFVD